MQVLLRALRDFNLGKLTADDTGIFMGLLNDLFPKTVEQVSRAIDHEFEAKVRLPSERERERERERGREREIAGLLPGLSSPDRTASSLSLLSTRTTPTTMTIIKMLRC